MNFLKKSFLTCATGAIFAGGLLLAQGPGGFGPGGPRGGRQLAFLANYLGLTGAQKAQAKAIFTTERQTAHPVLAQLKLQRDAVGAAIAAGQSAEQVSQLAAAEGPLLGQAAAIHAGAQVQFFAILTPEQQAKLQSLHAAMKDGPPPPAPPQP